MRHLTFFVPGQVKTNERARVRRGGVYDTEDNRLNKQAIRDIFCRDYPSLTPHEGPVQVVYEARFLPPKTNYWPGKRCLKKPDFDNFGKLVGDALNCVAFRDDSQIDDAHLKKRYCREGEVEGIEVRLEFHEQTPKPVKARTKKQ